MKLFNVFSSLIFISFSLVLPVQAQNKVIHEGPSTSKPFDKFVFQATGIKPNGKELTLSRAYYDPASGRTANLVKFQAGFVSAVHTHTEDCYAVVVKGTMSNHKPGVKGEALPVGSYWFQRGEEPHVTECSSKEDCLAMVVTRGESDNHILEKSP